MPLTPEQLTALPHLEWFFDESDDGRRTGRTTVGAIALIRLACEDPGQTIRVADHYNQRQSADYLAEVIRDLVNSDYRIAPHLEWRGSRLAFRINLPRPFPRWLPPEDYFASLAARSLGGASAARLRNRGAPVTLNGMALSGEEAERVRSWYRDSQVTQEFIQGTYGVPPGQITQIAGNLELENAVQRMLRGAGIQADPSYIEPPQKSRLDILLEDDITTEP